MCGAGNSFAVIDARGLSPEFSGLARKLCKVLHTDGFLALDTGKNADLRLHYYNRDGSRAALCGNGARCLCRFAWEKGLASETMTLQTDAGLLTGQRLSQGRYRVSLPSPQCLRREKGYAFVAVGVPHVLVEVPMLHPGLRETARTLRKALDANVDFYTSLGPERIRLLTYERGVEDFTQACGTGCGAAAAVLQVPHLQIHTPGGVLEVDALPQGLTLSGPTRVVRVVEWNPS